MALSKIKTALELEYWKSVKKIDFSVRYKKLLNIWGISKDLGEVLEIGTGPRGGVLPFVKGKKKLGLDPLYIEFKTNDLLTKFPDIKYQVGCIENITLKDTFDTILTSDSLDHGKSNFRSFGKITTLLKPGGRLFLHVHLRKPEQLNQGHDHALTLKQYYTNATANDLKELWQHIYETDPLDSTHNPYKTLVSCLEKPKRKNKNDHS